MKSLPIIFLILSFLGIAVFGFLAINHGNEHEHTGCIVTTAKGVDCPFSANTFLFAVFHLDTLKSFSTATFNYNYFNSIILLTLLVLLLGWISHFRTKSDLLTLASAQYRLSKKEFYFSPFQQNLIGWLALHENSPTVSS